MPVLRYLAIGTLGVGLVAGALVAFNRDLARRYRIERAADHGRPKPPAPIITEADIAALPPPIQRYMRASGSVGKPRTASVLVTFDAELRRRPGEPGMRGPADQYDAFDKPKRLFFMTSRMNGLPVKVLHDYDGEHASMRVTIASLVPVVDISGDALARAETVTLLNDMCLFAPSWLLDPRLVWRPIDDHQAAVSFTNGPYRVGATLTVDDAGDLVTFSSDDRGAVQPDGSFRRARWSTPVADARTFDGRRIPTVGKAIWHFPEGDFVYGIFRVRAVRYDL